MTERHDPMDRLQAAWTAPCAPGRRAPPARRHAQRDPQPEAPLNPSERLRHRADAHQPHRRSVRPGAYQGQASTATLPHVRHAMEAAARGGGSLARATASVSWAVPSRLNPLFYAVSYALGAGAGLAGNRWSWASSRRPSTGWCATWRITSPACPPATGATAPSWSRCARTSCATVTAERGARPAAAHQRRHGADEQSLTFTPTESRQWVIEINSCAGESCP